MFWQNTRGGGSVDWSDTMRFRWGVLRGNWILTVTAYKTFSSVFWPDWKTLRAYRMMSVCLSIRPTSTFWLTFALKLEFSQESGHTIFSGFFLSKKKDSDSKNKYSEDGIIKMLEFLVDTIFVGVLIFFLGGGEVFKQIAGIPMGTNCTPF